MKVRLQLLAIAYLLLCYMQTKGIGGAGEAIGVAMNATSVGDTWDGYPKGITLFAVPEQYYVQEISSDK